MSLPGKQTINVGLPNESTGSDSLFTAFTKINDNFSSLFANASPYETFVGDAGISVASVPETGTVTLTNTGVLSLTAGTNIVLSRANGNITISASGAGSSGGTVTSIGITPVSASRMTVTNSPIVSSGNINIDLAASGAVAGVYSNPTLTVDAYGRVTSVASGPASGSVTSVGLVAGTGVQISGGPITTTGTITVTNTGVTRLVAGSGISLSGSNGNVTVSASGILTDIRMSSDSLTVTGSPVINSGQFTIELKPNANFSGTVTAGNIGINTVSTTALLDVNANTVRVRSSRTPATAGATGNAGDICWDANYVYVCISANTWKRANLATW